VQLQTALKLSERAKCHTNNQNQNTTFYENNFFGVIIKKVLLFEKSLQQLSVIIPKYDKNINLTTTKYIH